MRDLGYLHDMLTAARLVARYTAGLTFQEFAANIEKQDSVIRRIEVIGEAANRVSAETRSTLPNLDWHRMVGMRHFIVHQYREIDLEIVWSVVTERLPGLIGELEKFFP